MDQSIDDRHEDQRADVGVRAPGQCRCAPSVGCLALAGGLGYPGGQMRLLDRYLLRELLIPLGYCVGGLLIFWVSFDLFTKLEDFHQDKLSALEIARYYLLVIPGM